MKLARDETKIRVTGRSFHRKNNFKFKGRNRNRSRNRGQKIWHPEPEPRQNGIVPQHWREQHQQCWPRSQEPFTNVRLHLEFAVQAWSPWSQQDKEVLERVQKRAVNMVSSLQGTSYEEKIGEAGSDS